MSKFTAFMNKIHWKHYIPYALILVFLLFTFIITPSMSSQFLYEQIAISILLAISLNFIVGFLGELSLGHAGFMCIGAFIGGKISSMVAATLGNNLLTLIISVLVGGIAAAAAGFIVGLPALRLKGDYLAIVTLAFGEIVRSLFLHSSNESFGGAFGLSTPRYDRKTLYIVAFVFVILAIAAFSNIIRSKHGRAITAIRDSEIAAKASGVNVTKYKLIAFVMAAFFAGIAGVLYSYSQSTIQSGHFDYNYSIDILVMVVFGGIGSMNGSIISATAITVVNVKLSELFTKLGLTEISAVENIIYALFLILIVIYTNAPALRSFRAKYNLKNLFDWILEKVFKKKKDPSVIRDDDHAWDRVPTKIDMNEVISVDLKVQESTLNPDKNSDEGGFQK